MLKAGRVLELLMVLSFFLVWGLIWVCSSANFAFSQITEPIYWSSSPNREQWGMYANALFIPASATLSALLCCGLVRFIVGADAYDRTLAGERGPFYPWADKKIVVGLVATVPISILLIAIFSTNRVSIANDGIYTRSAPWSSPHVHGWGQVRRIRVWCYYSKGWKEGLTFDFDDNFTVSTAYLVTFSSSDPIDTVSIQIISVSNPIKRLRVKIDAAEFSRNCSRVDLNYLSGLNSNVKKYR